MSVGESGGDLLASCFEDPQDRFVRQRVEDPAHDREADALRNQMRPVNAKRARDLSGLATLSRGLHRKNQHSGHSIAAVVVR